MRRGWIGSGAFAFSCYDKVLMDIVSKNISAIDAGAVAEIESLTLTCTENILGLSKDDIDLVLLGGRRSLAHMEILDRCIYLMAFQICNEGNSLMRNTIHYESREQ